MGKTQHYFTAFALLAGFASLPALAAENQPVAPDNSQVNVRDRDASESTSDQGGNQKSDRQIMQDIRKSVIADKSLSTYAHNIKIVAVSGKVTLKGPVRTQTESDNIQAKAASAVGTDNVTNEISIKPAQ